MKVIERIQMEYVVPETEEERLEIEKIIKDFEANKFKKLDLSKATIVDNSKALDGGYWRETNSQKDQ